MAEKGGGSAVGYEDQDYRFVEIDAMTDPKDALPSLPLGCREEPREAQAVAKSLQAVLESVIAALPDTYRPAVMLRDVQDLTTAEAAEYLDLTEPVIKVRLHRGRALLRRDLATRSGEVLGKTFEFGAARCDRVVAAVLAWIGGWGGGLGLGYRLGSDDPWITVQGRSIDGLDVLDEAIGQPSRDIHQPFKAVDGN
jgi:Sigma-70, region 4